MPAKKNIIKDLRKEILSLRDEIKGRDQEIKHQVKMHERTKRNHEFELSMINSHTNNIASGLKYRFSKDLTWLELCDDPDSKMQIVREAITSLQLIAKPNGED